MRGLLSLLRPDAQAARVVPPTGYTANLTVFAAGAMALLAVFALALSLSMGRLAQSWEADLAASATLRLAAGAAEAEVAQTEAALAVLETTPGIVSARVMTEAEQRALLSPWLGADLDVGALPVPQLIDLELDLRRFDAEGLRLRLSAEVPGAVLEDHALWRAPLLKAAHRLRLLGWMISMLIFAVLGAIVTLAARAALAANAQVVAVLRLVGATDDYIAGAFVRRFALRTAIGSAGGTVLGLLALWFVPAQSAGPLLTNLRFEGAGWLVPLLVPILAIVVGVLAITAAARKALRELA